MLPATVTVPAGLVACRCLMELKIRVPGARRGGTGIMNATGSGQGPAPGPGRRPGDLGGNVQDLVGFCQDLVANK